MGLRFFHRFPLSRFLTLNVSKRGASVSVGVPGAHLTTGTHGTRATVGLPGTGLFYTQVLKLPTPTSHVAAWQAELATCAQQPFEPIAYAAVLNRLAHYRLTEADLPPETRTVVEQIRTVLRDQFGYRLEHRIAAAPAPRPRASRVVPLILVAILVAGSLLAIWYLS
jgi:hypothetical protein